MLTGHCISGLGTARYDFVVHTDKVHCFPNKLKTIFEDGSLNVILPIHIVPACFTVMEAVSRKAFIQVISRCTRVREISRASQQAC